MSLDDYDPAKEVDPLKLQQQAVEQQREALEMMREEKARRDALEAERAEAPIGAIGTYTPPTFEEISARIVKCWEEVKRVLPDAPDPVKCRAFEALMHVNSGAFL